MNLLNILLMMPSSGGAQGGGGMSQIIMIVMIIVIFYFFMIRPQTKKAKQEKEFKESLKKGDKVVTIGGIHGKIIDVSDKTFVVEISDGVKVKVEKSAVAMDATKTVVEPAK